MSDQDHFNLTRAQLRAHIPKIEWNQLVFPYVVRTLKKDSEDKFLQEGSAPNFRGGVITLCTCKHLMRTRLNHITDWKNIWIAGSSGINLTTKRRNALFYLMKVAKPFESHSDLWSSGMLSDEVKLQKAASEQTLGDLYKPYEDQRLYDVDRFDHRNYEPPRKDHDHAPYFWHQDINYLGYGNRRPALLVGHKIYSFLWNKPSLYLTYELPRNPESLTLRKFLDTLRSR